VFQPLTPKDERSGLLMRAATESVSLCARMNCWPRFWNSKSQLAVNGMAF
jgi:hypothetical protein